MATSKTYYYCDLCGENYTKEKDALACEKSHAIPLEVSPHYYNRYREDKPVYPDDVTVKFSDGTTEIYYRKKRELDIY